MKITAGLLALFFFVLIAGYWWSDRNTDTVSEALQTATTTSSTTPTVPVAQEDEDTTVPPAAGATSYTLAQVALHDTNRSCWAAISGSVYDLTTWISEHPGGAARILSICGKDGTSAFTGQHGNDPRAQSMLVNFKIGTLAQ